MTYLSLTIVLHAMYTMQVQLPICGLKFALKKYQSFISI